MKLSSMIFLSIFTLWLIANIQADTFTNWPDITNYIAAVNTGTHCTVALNKRIRATGMTTPDTRCGPQQLIVSNMQNQMEQLMPYYVDITQSDQGAGGHDFTFSTYLYGLGSSNYNISHLQTSILPTTTVDSVVAYWTTSGSHDGTWNKVQPWGLACMEDPEAWPTIAKAVPLFQVTKGIGTIYSSTYSSHQAAWWIYSNEAVNLEGSMAINGSDYSYSCEYFAHQSYPDFYNMKSEVCTTAWYEYAEADAAVCGYAPVSKLVTTDAEWPDPPEPGYNVWLSILSSRARIRCTGIYTGHSARLTYYVYTAGTSDGSIPIIDKEYTLQDLIDTKPTGSSNITSAFIGNLTCYNGTNFIPLSPIDIDNCYDSYLTNTLLPPWGCWRDSSWRAFGTPITVAEWDFDD